MPTNIKPRTYSFRRYYNAIKVFDDNKMSVATFNLSAASEYAFSCFKEGLARAGGARLFNEDTGQYVVGTIGDMTSEQLNPAR